MSSSENNSVNLIKFMFPDNQTANTYKENFQKINKMLEEDPNLISNHIAFLRLSIR